MLKKTLKKLFLSIILFLFLLPLVTKQLSPEFIWYLFTGDSYRLAIKKPERSFSEQEINPYFEYINQNALNPFDYVIKKFREKDLVIISENHWLQSHTGFVEKLMEPLVKSGIRDFAFEFGSAEHQKIMNDFIDKPELDKDLLYESLMTPHDIFGWPFKGYIEVFIKLREINQELKKHGDHLSVHLVDSPLGVNHKHVFWFRDKHMSDSISTLLKKQKKVFFYCGATHGQTGLFSLKSGKKYPSAGSLLHDEFKGRVFSIKLHSIGDSFKTKELTPFVGGLFDDLLKKYGKQAGFDLINSPFKNIKGSDVHDGLFYSSTKESILIDAWQGYIFPNNSNERVFCGIEEEIFKKDFVYKKLKKDSLITGSLIHLFFSPYQLAEACKLYKLQCLGFK